MSLTRSIVSLVVLLLVSTPLRVSGQDEAVRLSTSFKAAARQVLPAVVTVRGISGQISGKREASTTRDGSGGSGVIFDAARGLVLTNDHVVSGADRVVVTLHDGRERTATKVHRDPKSDLAVVVIPNDGLAQASWGDSETLEVGDWVLAIGQPFGLSGTVTAGIVSGTERGIGMALYEDLIQTDAAINPGNSGGPLVNLKGEIVGINAAIKSRSGGYEGIGFAVPSARARRVASDLAEFGKVRRGYLGLEVQRPEPDWIAKVREPNAVRIKAVVEGGPADRAGLGVGDVVLTIAGKPLRGTGMMQTTIEQAMAGEPLVLRIWRDGETLQVEVRPEAQPERLGLAVESSIVEPRNPIATRPSPEALAAPRTAGKFPELGLQLAEPTPELTRRFRLATPVDGLVIVGIEPEGPGDRGGLERGMVITDAGDRKVQSLADFRGAVARRAAGQDLVVRVLIGDKVEFRVLLDSKRIGTASARPDDGDIP